MKKIKGFFAALLCLCMVVTLLPTVAQALNNNVTLSVTVGGQPFVEKPLSINIYVLHTSAMTGKTTIVFEETANPTTNEHGVAYLTLTP